MIRFVLLLLLLSQPKAHANDLYLSTTATTCSLSVVTATPNSFVVEFHLKNTSGNSLKLIKAELPRETVVEGKRKLMEAVFDVSVNGKRAKYTGLHIYKVGPTESKYFLLGPGQEIHSQIEISASYRLTTGFVNVYMRGMTTEEGIASVTCTPIVVKLID